MSNPLILPSIGHTGDLGDIQLQSGGPRRWTSLDLPKDLVLKRLSCLNLFRDPPVQGSQEVDMPRTAQGPTLRMLTCLDLPRDSISRRLSCLSLPGDMHPDPGMPGSQVATVLGKISFKKTHP